MFDRSIYYETVRENIFYGSLTQQQVDGQNAILGVWEALRIVKPTFKLDNRWLAYMLATTYHECAGTMWPIEEYGKGNGSDYGVPDPETGQTYYGRGFVQLTWRDNYARATEELELEALDDLEWHADRALDTVIAARVMFKGMYDGWFRGDDEGRQTLPRYFNDTINDPVGARDIINGDVSKNGPMIAGYHENFLYALKQSETMISPIVEKPPLVAVALDVEPGSPIEFMVNGEVVFTREIS